MDDMNRDPVLGAALRDAYGDAPEMDLDALRARVSAAAELPLAARRRSRARSRGLRALVPLAAAAGIAAVAVATLPERRVPLSQADEAVVQEILDLSVPGEVGALMSGEAADQAL
ncbi:MAG TPA: hypothetical protein VLK84_03270, partial [Longimicrobium sp.]|nr:hypothetical protein [Longimicrobium sp.]